MTNIQSEERPCTSCKHNQGPWLGRDRDFCGIAGNSCKAERSFTDAEGCGPTGKYWNDDQDARIVMNQHDRET